MGDYIGFRVEGLNSFQGVYIYIYIYIYIRDYI